MKTLFCATFFIFILPSLALAQEQEDEPGLGTRADEPGLLTFLEENMRVTEGPSSSQPPFRLEMAFGYSSLLVDPDVGSGYGGGLYFAYGLNRRIGVELTTFFSRNFYEGQLGSFGTSFLAGNLTLGPIFQLTRPGSRLTITIDTGIGGYLIVPIFQESLWTLGISGGATLAFRLTRWFGIGLKWRYHLFNLARLSGPEFKDLKAFMKVGVIDRMEIPGYLAFYF